MRLSSLTLMLLVCATRVFAQQNTSGHTDIEDLTVWQLCEMRDEAAAVAELERRQIFSRRELRAIRKQDARRDIRLEALLCAIGRPDSIIPFPPVPGAERVELYLYSGRGQKDLTVSISHDGSQSIVIGVMTPRSERSKSAEGEGLAWARFGLIP